ncbi:ankyrin repeat and BTB/POZ domain-containing protein 1 [Schistocerca piceifrons]|uniref:ankyrin repeat and BTB/POZ domain-containing protein 1 n=1 Tax=Schistocerca piceifrons TaxID=274613 RepID=UPI001F5ECF48|nr:ankyrin repeat and BTB/POZ domain-containing protein 1 [Schistocerca piceifrons]XP_049951628.1 ankyrin repeat and BTB/POZ domain-containing protein 1 [Schistocerca serialis cubense]
MREELFRCCKQGNATRVKYLLENTDINPNVRDEWDSTPLYYACLCGHSQVVDLLLMNGAHCDANTFDGERCVYAALTDEISEKLRSYRVLSSRTMRRDYYDEFLRRLLQCSEYSDVTFVVHDEEFHLHKCILSSRSAYFCDKFRAKWQDRQVVTIKNSLVKSNAFRALIQYLYTGRLETHLDSVDDCILLSSNCKLFVLEEELKKALKKVTSSEYVKPGMHVKVIVLESSELTGQLQEDFGRMADDVVSCYEPQNFADLCLYVDGRSFYCHKLFVCGRSEYFSTLVRKDHFNEVNIDTEFDVPVIRINGVPVEVLAAVLYYIYTNAVNVPPDLLLDLLHAADMYLLPGLKKSCAALLGQYLNTECVMAYLHTARLLGLPQLEDQCAKFIAQNIYTMRNNKSLHQMILQDAMDIQHRQETDSISIVDDIRYHITSHIASISETIEANNKLKEIDELLETLGLDA